jgi:hypothetical protein
MDKDKNKKSRKYAFNINDINNDKKIKSSVLDFDNLNKGVYDQIELDDMTIRSNKENLKNIKNKSLKEFIYTNEDIPIQWKNKLDYQPNLLKIFVKDRDLLCYMGKGGPANILKIRKIKDKKANIPKMNKINMGKAINEKEEQEKTSLSLMRLTSNKINNKYGKFKEKHHYIDKEIVGILEDFKSAYPILIKEKENEINNEVYKGKNSRIINDKKNQTFYKSNTHYSIRHKNKIFALPNLKLKKSRRQNTFRQNIFTNLLPSNRKYISESPLEGNKTRSYFSFAKDKKNVYLNSDNDLFNKKIKINDPIMLKYLEGINFYGPYFSYCPPCGNKNLEFYKNLEQKQFLQIIQQIKKSKRKNVVLSDNKNKKIKNKRKVKEHLDKDDNDSYDIQVNNNYSESMINQFSSNNSKKD